MGRQNLMTWNLHRRKEISKNETLSRPTQSKDACRELLDLLRLSLVRSAQEAKDKRRVEIGRNSSFTCILRLVPKRERYYLQQVEGIMSLGIYLADMKVLFKHLLIFIYYTDNTSLTKFHLNLIIQVSMNKLSMSSSVA